MKHRSIRNAGRTPRQNLRYLFSHSSCSVCLTGSALDHVLDEIWQCAIYERYENIADLKENYIKLSN